MFLKQGSFNYEKQSVVLSELSGLQRIEYLAFVQQRTAKFDAEELMHLGEGISGGVRYGPDSQPGH